MDDVQKWLLAISNYDKAFKRWESRVEKILKRYRDDSTETNVKSHKFNILWSNIQTVVPAVFAKLPKPDVSRRFRDNDPVGRIAALILERALEFEIEHYPDYQAAMNNSVYDRFLGGRGVAWVRYEPHFRGIKKDSPEDGVQLTEDVEGHEEAAEEIDYECAPADYIHWKDFGHSIARTWEEVTSVWRKLYLGRSALIERFGEELGSKIPLDTKPENQDKNAIGSGDVSYQACIYEIWDKESGKALWLSKSLNKILDTRDDPLMLESFFPCPRPLFATITSDSLIPVPDFTIYQSQAKELDELCSRIDGLIRALKVRGVYDASVAELSRLFTEGESNTLIPVKNWQAFSEKQGLKGAIDLVDIQPIAFALMEAYKAMDQVKGQIYDLTGLSDIIRGQSEASETATAQQIKGQYASLRLKNMQKSVAEFAAELMQIKAQIMCQFFQPETLIQISAANQLSQEDQQLIPQAIQLLKDKPLRAFRVDISADSLVNMDEQAEKESRTEFLNATGSFIEKAVQASQSAPQIVPLIMEMLKFGVTGYRVGKTIEGQFDETAELLKKQIAEKQNQPPPPDPEMIKAQQQSQMEQARLQSDMQLEQQRMQMQGQMEQLKLQQEMQFRQMESQVKAQTDILIAKLNAMSRIEVAEIGANATLTSQATQAARDGVQE